MQQAHQGTSGCDVLYSQSPADRHSRKPALQKGKKKGKKRALQNKILDYSFRFGLIYQSNKACFEKVALLNGLLQTH